MKQKETQHKKHIHIFVSSADMFYNVIWSLLCFPKRIQVCYHDILFAFSTIESFAVVLLLDVCLNNISIVVIKYT